MRRNGTAQIAVALVLALGAGIPLWQFGTRLVLTRFEAPLNVSGFALVNLTTSWPVSGVTAPTASWDARDKTGSSGYTSHSFTATGSTESGTAPFNRTGDFATPSGGMQYQRFDGANDYYSSANGVGNPASGDFTVWCLYRTMATGDFVAAARVGGDGAGWSIETTAGGATCDVENNAGTQVTRDTTIDVSDTGWALVACSVDADGNTFAWANGTASATTASPGGAMTTATTPLVIGSADGGGTPLSGDVAVCGFHAVALTDGQLDNLLGYLTGTLDSKGAAFANRSNTGPYCVTFAGQLECFSDDFGPVVGGEMAPGDTGAGSPAAALLITPGTARTNSVIQSNDLSVTWTTVDGGGAAVVSAASTTPFAGGRAVSHIKDDQAGTIEYVQNNAGGVTVTSLNAGDKITVTVWARDDSGTVLDAQFVESGGCGGSTTDTGAKTITTTWTRYTFQHTLADTTCTTFHLRLSPADFGAAANTGDADVGQIGIWANGGAAGGQSTAPPHEIVTTTAAVSAGSDIIGWTITSSGIVNGSGAFVGNVVTSHKFAPCVADNGVTSAQFTLAKDATDYLQVTWSSTTERFVLTDGTTHGQTDVYTTIGTLALIEADANYDTDAYRIRLNSGAWVTDATADASPTGITTLRLGSKTATATSTTGGFWISEIEVTR